MWVRAKEKIQLSAYEPGNIRISYSAQKGSKWLAFYEPGVGKDSHGEPDEALVWRVNRRYCNLRMTKEQFHELFEQAGVSEKEKRRTAEKIEYIMLQHYAAASGITYEEAYQLFRHSKTYEALYDFETEIWKEGPEYLRDWFEEELKQAKDAGPEVKIKADSV